MVPSLKITMPITGRRQPSFEFKRYVSASCPRCNQRQSLSYLLNRPFGIRPVLSRPRAAARVMGNFHHRKLGQAKEFGFRARQLHENRLAKGYRWFSFLLQFDGVVDTPRRAGPSSA